MPLVDWSNAYIGTAPVVAVYQGATLVWEPGGGTPTPVGSFSDTFNRSDGALGSSWIVMSGSGAPAIATNALVATVSGSVYNAAKWAEPLTSADHSIEAIVAGLGSDFNGGIELFTRMDPDSTSDSTMDGYLFNVYTLSGLTTMELTIYEVNNGAVSAISSTDTIAIPSFPFTVRAESVGDVHTLYVNDVAEVTATDSTFATQVHVGVDVYLPAGTSSRIDAIAGGIVTTGQSFSDDFNRADGGLADANWLNVPAPGGYAWAEPPQIVGNRVVSNGATGAVYGLTAWDTPCDTLDQFSSATIGIPTDVPGGINGIYNGVQLNCRVQDSLDVWTFYNLEWYWDLNVGFNETWHFYLIRCVNNVNTFLLDDTTSVSPGTHDFRLEVTGTSPVVITAFVDDVQVATYSDSDGARLIDGHHVGIAPYHFVYDLGWNEIATATPPWVDDWSGGDLLSPAKVLLASMDCWWEAETYSGSGVVLNQGTTGSTHDLTITGTVGWADSAAFAGGKAFALHDVTALLSTASDMVFGADEDITIGVITQDNGGFGSGPSAYNIGGEAIGLSLVNNSSITGFRAHVGQGVNPDQISPPGFADRYLPSRLWTVKRNAAAAEVSLKRNLSSGAVVFDQTFGSSITLDSFNLKAPDSYPALSVSVAFVYRGQLTDEQLTLIMARYGVT